MPNYVLETLGLIHLPLGAYLVYLCVKAQSVLTDKKAKKGLDYVIAFAGAVVAIRLTQLSIPLNPTLQTSFWRTITTLGLVSFVPIIRSLVRIERNRTP